jgi:hypothetical protein
VFPRNPPDLGGDGGSAQRSFQCLLGIAKAWPMPRRSPLCLRVKPMSQHHLGLRMGLPEGGRWRRSDESSGKEQEGIADPLKEGMTEGPLPRPIMASRAGRRMLFYLQPICCPQAAPSPNPIVT